MSKISVIIPIYKVEKYLQQCVDSIRNQTFQDIEIILVDDGSPDGCGKMCDAFALEDNRIKVIHKENGGLSSARNAGLMVAGGEYVSFIDSDDYTDLQMLEKMYQAAVQSNSDLIGCGFYEMNCDGEWKIFHANLPSGVYNHETIVEEIVKNILGNDRKVGAKKCQGYAWLNLYRRDIISTYHIEFPSERVYFHEDELFLLQFLYHSQTVSFIDEPLYYYCFNGNSLSKGYRPGMWEMSKHLIAAFRDFSKKFGIEDECRRRIDLYMLSYVSIAVQNECYPTSGRTAMQQIGFIAKICEDTEVQRVLMQPLPESEERKVKIKFRLVKGKHAVLIYIWYKIRQTRCYRRVEARRR